MAAKFNDANLRNQALKLNDPYAQPDLIIDEIPERAILLDLLNIYSFERWPKEKVYCVACKGRHHKRGFTALLSNGARALFGSTCGERLFGESWKAAEKRIEDRANRQHELIKLDRLSLVAEDLHRGLLTWVDGMERVVARRRAFENNLSELASRVGDAARRCGGMLMAVQRIQSRPDRGAEVKDHPGEYIEAPIGRLAGAALFQAFDPIRAVARTIDALDEMRIGLGETDFTWTSKLAKRRKTFERTFPDLEMAASMYEAAHEFFEIGNFRKLTNLVHAHHLTKARYEITHDGIVRDEETLSGIKLAPIADLDTNPLDLIQEYRRAD